MDLPLSVILTTINDFCVLHFKDKKLDPEAPPHFYVIFPVNPIPRFSINIITSQIKKREEFYRHNNAKALKALVKINNDIFAFLAKESIIDCNRMELVSKEELGNRIDPSVPCKIKSKEVPSFVKKEIFSAINQSPLLSRAAKKDIEKIRKEYNT